MEKLARQIAEAICTATGQDEEKTRVVAYGLAAIFQAIVIFLIILFFGLIGGFAIESLILFLGVGILRKAVGGAHASTMKSCIIISVVTITALASTARYVFNFKHGLLTVCVISAVVYFISYILIYKYAPVDSPNKPIVKLKKIERLRKEAFITQSVYILATIVLLLLNNENIRFISFSASFVFASAWQSFMLTKPGHILITVVDKHIR